MFARSFRYLGRASSFHTLSRPIQRFQIRSYQFQLNKTNYLSKLSSSLLMNLAYSQDFYLLSTEDVESLLSKVEEEQVLGLRLLSIK
ncbi:unnamed protein product [Blepharisma stoltei]|uniref:Ribosomal protein L20 n=1 Tax=Blepharisma stoltei TaxID=1481888 RepID=A0AAU9JPG8_9CILI|nr:unnamed protein product [Blepharisma stoltei]